MAPTVTPTETAVTEPTEQSTEAPTEPFTELPTEAPTEPEWVPEYNGALGSAGSLRGTTLPCLPTQSAAAWPQYNFVSFQFLIQEDLYHAAQQVS